VGGGGIPGTNRTWTIRDGAGTFYEEEI